MFRNSNKLERPYIFLVVIILSFLVKNCLSIQNNVNNNGNEAHSYGRSRSKPKDTSCDITTYITNCSPDVESRATFSRYRYAIFLGSTNIQRCDSEAKQMANVIMNWELWKQEESEEEKVEVIIGKKVFLVKQDSLAFGIYKLKLITNVFFIDHAMHSEMDVCYFEIVETGTQTIIYGGSLRTINFQYGIYFEVLTMLAPDRITLSKTTQVSYWWSCKSSEIFCTPYNTSETQRLIKGPLKHFVDSGKLPYDYEFQLSIVVSVLQSKRTPNVQIETQKIRITKDPGVNIGIVCLFNCGGKIFGTNNQEIIHLEAKFDQSIFEIAPRKEVKCIWNYSTGHDDEKVVPKEAKSDDSWTED